jgi:hypothetical protein
VQDTVAVVSPPQDMENTAIPIEGASDLGQVKDHESTEVVEIKDQQPTTKVNDVKCEEIKEQQPTLEVEDVKTEGIKEQQPTPKVDDTKPEETSDQQPTPKVEDIKIEEIKEQQPTPKVDDVKTEETDDQQPTPQVDGVKDQESTSQYQQPVPKVETPQADEIKVDQTATLKTEQPQEPVEQHVYDPVPNSTIDNDYLKSSEKTASVDYVATTNNSGMKNKSSQQGASTKRKSVFGLFKKEKVNNGTYAQREGVVIVGLLIDYLPLHHLIQ